MHGFGATHDMMLPQYEQHFASAGIATLAFDYRNTGASDGQPRQHISLRAQRADVAAALSFAMSRADIAPARVGLWGTSLGGMNVLRVAAARDDVAVAVVQCPMVHGPAAVRSLGVVAPLRLAPYIAVDAVRAVLRGGRRYVSIVGPPGSLAVVTIAGAEAGWNSTVPPGGQFENRVAAADAVGLVVTSALRHARHITVRMRPGKPHRSEIRGAGRAAAPRGVARHYDSDHFEIYHPPLVERVLADQTAFLREHLDVCA